MSSITLKDVLFILALPWLLLGYAVLCLLHAIAVRLRRD